MKEKRKIPKLSDRLPVHSPDEFLWSGISSALDQLEAQEKYSEKLTNLPVHKPDASAWPRILMRMQRTALLRRSAFTLLATAATIALFISVFRTREYLPERSSVSPPSVVKLGTGDALNHGGRTPVSRSAAERENSVSNISPVQLARSDSHAPSTVEVQDLIQVSDQASSDQKMNRGNPGTIMLLASRTELLHRRVVPFISRNSQEPANRNVMITQLPGRKYYSPDPYPQKKNPARTTFSLAANYLPESLENGNGTSLFHNFGLMASLGNEKTRVQSSIGMAYNSEHRVYDVNYTQFIPITIPIPGSNSDSTAIMEATGASELEGTERHQYFTYDLGVGRKLFTMGKMTTWFNTGAGVAVRLDDASLRETTIKTINQHNNSQVNTMDLEIPDYNGVNVNLMAGLDFNYRILERLSISFAPTSRIYLKPVLEKEGSSTDSFSIGFRSGMKFDF